MPPGERKSGMPDSVEMPAPVKATMRLAEAINSCSRWMSSMFPPITRSRRRRGAIVPANISPGDADRPTDGDHLADGGIDKRRQAGLDRGCGCGTFGHDGAGQNL